VKIGFAAAFPKIACGGMKTNSVNAVPLIGDDGTSFSALQLTSTTYTEYITGVKIFCFCID